MNDIRIFAFGGIFLLAVSPAHSAGHLMPGDYRLPAPHIVLVQSGAKGCKIGDMKGPSGTRIGLAVTILPGSEGESGTLFLGGLPEQVALTAGAKVNSLWAIPAKDAGKAAIVAPSTFTGQFGIRLQCIIGGRQFEDTANLSIEAAPVEMTRATVASDLLPRVTNQAETLNSHPLMKQAGELLEAGDIARARLLFEHLAMKGSPRAAFSLGRTYDPAYLNSIYVRGISPDIELAARWYRLASDLGEAEASKRLSALGK